ncbi:MAG: YggS family pyridoxal phosphate-dependent enzyme [Bacteroidales bacterium]|nr:YggS family pyridoxal phosphate-dependent enzyme [Bacteroidales bacterium]
MQISENLKNILHSLPEKVKLIAVSKNHSVSEISEAYQAGQKVFGENKVQELMEKVDKLPSDIEWHLIGHLQTNKVKYIAPVVNWIHSVDSFKLLKTINNEALKHNRHIDCLIQMYIASEETKFGLSLPEAKELLLNPETSTFTNIRIRGLMGMASFTDDKNQVRNEFASLRNYFNELKQGFFPNNPLFSEISMGMSDDYPIAIEQGSTMVRIGTAIFGQRVY